MQAMNQWMGRLVAFCVLVVGLAMSTEADAARVQPIFNVESAPIPDGLSMETIEDAIFEGCAARSWIANRVEDGHMQCTLHVRSHMATVDIRFDESTYSIVYNSSNNLKYSGDGRIHRNYNSWVQNLNGDLQLSLLRASRSR